MPNYDAITRSAIARYRFVDGLTFKELSTKMEGVNASTARRYCARLKESFPEASNEDLVRIASKKRPRGDCTRVKPGSRASLAIRNAVRAQRASVEAANLALQRTRDPTVKEPLKELSANTVRNILNSKAHCEKDPFDQHPIVAKRVGSTKK
jgi:hypothetical protein